MDSQLTTANKPPNHQVGVQRLPVLPWKTRLSLFFLSAINDAARRTDGTVNRRLFDVIELCSFKTPPDPKPRNGVTTSDLTIDPSRNLWFRIFLPSPNDDPPRLPVVVFFHGGGFVYLAPDFKAYDNVCRRFAREIRAVVVSVNYRLAPEHRYLAQYDDGFDVLKFLDDRSDVLPENADISQCFLAGDSAGGNLAHHVAKRACQSEFNRLKVMGVVAIQPFFEGQERTRSEIELAGVDAVVSTERTDWMWKAFMPLEDKWDRDHEVINVSGPRAPDISKLKDFPAAMVVVGGFDSLKDWQLRYYEYLKKSGKKAYLVEFPDMIHAFYIFPELPQSAHLISEIRQFIYAHC
ncbi:probable carboxylesterase 18 [Andrographis paniculata]|uniref:probable carboxylesterase 18 n=1 Tax=Andrographis paniculata TaxID=175694 RepID=UPI0021E8E404|nr:probable carboxylesterase 18 [Andrographis paniculata]